MFEGVRQLGQHVKFIAPVHTANVIAFEGVHEALGHVRGVHIGVSSNPV